MRTYLAAALLATAVPSALAQAPAAQNCKSGDAVFRVHSDNIETTKKQAADYKPGARDYYLPGGKRDCGRRPSTRNAC